MNVGDLSETSKPEYQVVLIIECEDGKLFPLVESTPRCCLPIANRPLLFYQLDLLLLSGATEVLLVVPNEYHIAVSRHVSNYSASIEVIGKSLNIDLVIVDDNMMGGSADGLRAVNDRIRGDFICMCADFISQFSLGELVRRHKMNASDMTMILAAIPVEEPDKKGGIKKVKVDDEDQEFHGLCEDGRVVMKMPAMEIEEGEHVTISKPLLHKCKSLTMRTDLLDMGVYVMSRWILEFLMTNKKISSLRMDLVPFLVKRQFQSSQYLLRTFPSLEHRQRPLQTIETWLKNSTNIDIQALGIERNLATTATSSSSPSSKTNMRSTANQDALTGSSSSSNGNGNNSNNNNSMSSSSTSNISYMNQGLADYLAQEMSVGIQSDFSLQSPSSSSSSSNSSNNKNLTTFSASKSSLSLASSNNSLSSAAAQAHHSKSTDASDLVRCFALVYETGSRYGDDMSNSSSNHFSSSSHDIISKDVGNTFLLQRITNIHTYMNLNRDFPLQIYDDKYTPWPRLIGYQKKEQSIIGTSCEINEKVTMKQCCIGHSSIIGNKSKLNVCIIMESVNIGENCVIQNSVICAGAIIESNCNINECYIASGAKIHAGTKIKGESIMAESLKGE